MHVIISEWAYIVNNERYQRDVMCVANWHIHNKTAGENAMKKFRLPNNCQLWTVIHFWSWLLYPPFIIQPQPLSTKLFSLLVKRYVHIMQIQFQCHASFSIVTLLPIITLLILVDFCGVLSKKVCLGLMPSNCTARFIAYANNCSYVCMFLWSCDTKDVVRCKFYWSPRIFHGTTGRYIFRFQIEWHHAKLDKRQCCDFSFFFFFVFFLPE